ncbi:MAG TPA: Fic family protein [Vitreimonas sp.]|nr:Fic family protein [Vitreimonas sp.]
MNVLEFPLVTVTPDIKALVDELVIQTQVLKRLPVETKFKTEVFHQQILKSSLFSARIEGNQLTLIQAQQANLTDERDLSKLEISNVLKALRSIGTLPTHLEIQHWLDLHQHVMAGISEEAGKLRREPSAIFDQFGNVVYLTPSPDQMRAMMDFWFTENKTLSDSSHSVAEKLVLSFASHYYFEKIHPFIDGNGRTGRVLLHYQLAQTGLFTETLIPIDHYLETHKSTYYAYLEKNTRQLHEFYLFMLTGLLEKTTQLVDELSQKPPTLPASMPQTSPSSLLPRRQEILNIITDHPYCSLNQITRRFPTIPTRTISYDVNSLVKNGLVIKHGSTRGVSYSVNNEL